MLTVAVLPADRYSQRDTSPWQEGDQEPCHVSEGSQPPIPVHVAMFGPDHLDCDIAQGIVGKIQRGAEQSERSRRQHDVQAAQVIVGGIEIGEILLVHLADLPQKQEDDEFAQYRRRM